MEIYVINNARLPELECIKMVNATIAVLPQFCSDWNIPIPKITYASQFYPYMKTCVYLSPFSSSDWFPAFHTYMGDSIYATIFVGSILKNGGCLSNENPKGITVSKAMSHEIFELLVNPKLNNHKNGFLVEVCDPVAYNDVIQDGVTLSDWILPSWFGGSGVYNHLNTLKKPYSIDAGGLTKKR